MYNVQLSIKKGTIMKLSSKLAILSSSAAAAAAACVLVSEKSIMTSEYNLKTDKVSSPLRVVALSDLHFSSFGRDNKRLIESVEKAEPDIILLSGDFFDFRSGRSNGDIVVKTLKALSSVARTGNHELRYNIKTGENCFEYAENAGVTVLNGEYRDIDIKGQKVRIGGVYDHAAHIEDFADWHESKVYSFLREFENTPSLTLLMLHRPNTFIYTRDLYKDEVWDIGAVFSGHGHGGIWRVPFFGGVYAPEQGFFPEYDRGEYSFGKTKMYLSSGLEGYYFVPRLFNRPEIIKLIIDK